MGRHGNHACSHIPNKLIFKDDIVSILGGPNEKNWHEKLSWGAGTVT